MSTVYHATDITSQQRAAAKLLSPAFAYDARACDLARREADVIRQVRHPSVPRLYHHGDAVLPDGTVVPCTVMEYLDGTMLTERLRFGPLIWTDAVQITATIADALAVAHRRGIVHRDITSENLIITEAGVKIIDFGLAATGPRGTPDPQLAADDVYALGVLLYQMLTGASPYPQVLAGTDPAARMRGMAPTPVLAVPGLPRAVADLCRACMAKRATDRPDSSSVALALWGLLVPQGPLV